MAKPGKQTPGLSEASGSRPVTGLRSSMISAEPTVVHSEQQDEDLPSQQTTDEQTVEASESLEDAGAPADGEGVAAERFSELRLPTPLLAQLDAIAKQECNIHQVPFSHASPNSVGASRCTGSNIRNPELVHTFTAINMYGWLPCATLTLCIANCGSLHFSIFESV